MNITGYWDVYNKVLAPAQDLKRGIAGAMPSSGLLGARMGALLTAVLTCQGWGCLDAMCGTVPFSRDNPCCAAAMHQLWDCLGGRALLRSAVSIVRLDWGMHAATAAPGCFAR